LNLVYVVKRFPKVSEAFVLQEIQELLRQGERVTICSLRRPLPGDPAHPGAAELVEGTIYAPHGGMRSLLLLVAAGARVLATSPRRALSALGWTLDLALERRDVGVLERFGEAAYLEARLPPDAEHLHAHFANAPATVALLLSRLTGRPFSFTGHASDIFELPDGELRPKLGAARFAAAVSEYTRSYLAARAGREHALKVVVVRNGVDRERFPAREREPEGVPLILSVGRLVEKKGMDTLVDACARLAARRREFRCEVVGDGSQRERLEERAQELGLRSRVVFVGSRTHDALPATLASATVFVLPSREASSGKREGLPVALTEAMAVGVPVVTTPVSGIPEVVRDGESGLLVPPDDPDALADALERVLADGGLRRRLAAGARPAAAEFDLSRSTARLRRLFRDGPPGLGASGARMTEDVLLHRLQRAYRPVVKRLYRKPLRPPLSLLYRGNDVVCPLCGGTFARFAPTIKPTGPNRPDSQCPRCGVREKHRHLWLYLQRKTNLFSEPLRLLHFAPEHALESRLRTLPNIDYVTADLYRPDVTARIDITDIPYDEGTFDAVICSHVLEHVADDRKALSELHRVLAGGGWAVVAVPVDPRRAETVEDPRPARPGTPPARQRLYGRDFAARCTEAGFDVDVVNLAPDLGDELSRRYGLRPGKDDLYVCRKPPDAATRHAEASDRAALSSA
jgi:glycosyltransferase involved in cell wall biosynthesis/SAM-dependent methyltransferase